MTDIPDWDDDILGDGVADDVIELTDIVDDSTDELDDSVIELTDIVSDDLDEVPGIKAEDDVIELTDIAEDDMSLEAAPDFDAEPVPDEESAMDELGADGFDLDDDFSMEEESVQEPEEPGAEEISMVETAAPQVSVPDAAEPQVSVSMDDIAAALDRVIEKKFADRIESILFEVMEKVVEKEIRQIKNILLKDLDQNGNV